jgi:hypothetical protein
MESQNNHNIESPINGILVLLSVLHEIISETMKKIQSRC